MHWVGFKNRQPLGLAIRLIILAASVQTIKELYLLLLDYKMCTFSALLLPKLTRRKIVSREERQICSYLF
jgi:hypothetical protein